MAKKILLFLVFILLTAGVAFGVNKLLGRGGISLPGEKITLTYWGLFEPPELIQPLIEAYQKDHPNVTIEYSQRTYPSLGQYKDTLLSRLQEGVGPDIMRVHPSWLTTFLPELSPAPSAVISYTDFSSSFYPVAVDSLTVDQAIYALPLGYDGLVVFYNKAMLGKVGLDSPPTTWGEFRRVATQLTERSEGGNKILQAGVAIGTSTNIDHAPDILGLMLVQSGVEIPRDLGSQAAQDALIFYTNFATKDRVWDETLPEAISAFARGELAMMLAPSWEFFVVKERNPGLDFAFSPVPQLPVAPGEEGTVNWASFWAEAVSRDSEHAEEAWDFLNYLSSAQSLQEFYSNAAAVRAFGEPYSRQDLADNLTVDPFASVLISGANTAKTGALCGRVGNDFEVAAANAAIETVVRGGSVSTALGTMKKALEASR